MTFAINYKGTSQKLTAWTHHERYQKFLILNEKLKALVTEEEIQEKWKKGYFYEINGDIEDLEITIKKISV